MFHVVLSGKIITSDDKSLIKKLENLIEQEKASIEGIFVSYEVEEIKTKTENDSNKNSSNTDL